MAREMKYSGIEWIGQIPNSWGINKIKHNFSIVSGATPKSENADYWDGDILWITPADFKTQDKYVVRGKRNISQAGYDSCGTTLVPENSVIFSKRAPVGTVAIAKTALCTNQGCLSCIPKKKTSSLFYYYAMSIFTEQFELVSTGTTFKEIAATVFSDFYLPHPSIEEQQRIATFLDSECSRIDSVIEQTRASIEEYKKLKQAVITQAVTKGIRPNREMKDSGIEWIGKINSDYSLQKIKYFISDYKAGPFGSALITGNLLDEGSILVYTPEHVAKQSDDIPNSLFLPENRREEMQQFFVEVGHIVFPIVGSLGRAMYITPEMKEGIINQRLAKFRINENIVDKDFFMYVFAKGDFYKQFLEVNSRGAIIVNLTKEIVYNMLFPLPSLSEQKEIVSYLDEKTREIARLIEKKEQYLLELESFKKSLIYEYVTGKKEVCAC